MNVIPLFTLKLTFRLNYRTHFGQSMWLSRDTSSGAFEILPMRWLNEEQWELELEISAHEAADIRYHYQLRQPGGAVLDEWNTPRQFTNPLPHAAELVLLDTWCSAGTVDAVFETKAFDAAFLTPERFQPLEIARNATAIFQLHMAAVPAGKVPCLLGNLAELGAWRREDALPMQAVSPNVWQVSLAISPHSSIEYKYGLLDRNSEHLADLEVGENRKFTSGKFTRVADECYRRASDELFRGAGVAIPVFSLRSDKGMGVGEFADLKKFGDWASNVGLELVQILPINDTTSAHDWTDSYPYSAISVFALHPLYLRLEAMRYAYAASEAENLRLKREQLNALPQVDYEAVMAVKWQVTRQIFTENEPAIRADRAFQEFFKSHRNWLVPYAVFCVKRDECGTADFTKWGEWAEYDAERAEAFVEATSEVMFHAWLQYELDLQLKDAVAHLHRRGLVLKGDLPIGIDRCSVDAWAAPELFQMHAQAGAPPDPFAVKGQNWGFPTYNWAVMQRDGFAWWRARFRHLSEYFDAYRIDHILGFFRIWQIPHEQIEGIMGYFDPALPVRLEEFHERGIAFELGRFCQPHLTEPFLSQRFGERCDEVKANHFDEIRPGFYQLRAGLSSQRMIEESIKDAELKLGLFDCVSEVLFFEVAGSSGTQFHPRCSMQATQSFLALDHETQRRLDELTNDYFYRRQEAFWQECGEEKLPAMRAASAMLLCGEDLGMVPECVPGVMRELGILSLEIQRMPKTSRSEFSDPKHAPYLSVVSPSTHDMPTLRAWWEEDRAAVEKFAREMLGLSTCEETLSGEVASQIISQHLESPAMWAVFPLQDLLAVDECLRHPQPETERINVPAIMPFYWRYRMHLTLDALKNASELNATLQGLISRGGR